VDREWVAMSDIAPAMARSAVAAEDAEFCNHWGLDLNAIRAALATGGDRGGSTISQQVAKNVFLWHGRNWAARRSRPRSPR
jgi:monofunctional biosynthetic peptidoglycan transglycosylase